MKSKKINKIYNLLLLLLNFVKNKCKKIIGNFFRKTDTKTEENMAENTDKVGLVKKNMNIYTCICIKM